MADIRQPADAVDLVMADEGTATPWTALGNPSEVGLIVPAGLTSCNLHVEVSSQADGTPGGMVVDKSGTQVLKVDATTGGFAFSSNEMGAVLGYGWLRVVSSVTQSAGPHTFTLTRKLVRISRLE